MTHIETDQNFRERLMRIVSDEDRPIAMLGITYQLDTLGQKYGKFRFGAPLLSDRTTAAALLAEVHGYPHRKIDESDANFAARVKAYWGIP